MEVVENLGFEVAGGSKESLAGNGVKCVQRRQTFPNPQLSQVLTLPNGPNIDQSSRLRSILVGLAR